MYKIYSILNDDIAVEIMLRKADTSRARMIGHLPKVTKVEGPGCLAMGETGITRTLSPA